jgi:hypothetical protein
VFIGQHLDRPAIESILKACELTAAEKALPQSHWNSVEDPFPAWDRIEN